MPDSSPQPGFYIFVERHERRWHKRLFADLHGLTYDQAREHADKLLAMGFQRVEIVWVPPAA